MVKSGQFFQMKQEYRAFKEENEQLKKKISSYTTINKLLNKMTGGKKKDLDEILESINGMKEDITNYQKVLHDKLSLISVFSAKFSDMNERSFINGSLCDKFSVEFDKFYNNAEVIR